MKYIQFILLLIIALATSCKSDQVKIGPNDFAIHNVSIADVKTGELWENMTLIIRGEKIDTIGKILHFGGCPWINSAFHGDKGVRDL